MYKDFSNGHFYSASDFYKNKFSCKVYKISINAGCSCPNRDGTKGTGGCIFCSASGSGDFATSAKLPIEKQIESAKEFVKNKNKCGKYIAYFQNFTNTWGNEKDLTKKYEETFLCKDVAGLAIATRPDAISDGILKKLSKLSEDKYVSIELGFQTSNEKSAEYINRCYKNSEYYSAVERIRLFAPNIHIVTHIIFGLPFETLEDMLCTVKAAVCAGTHGIKISVLHVLKETVLAEEFKKGNVKVLGMEEYFQMLAAALKVIPKEVVIHRLTGDGAKKILIAPLWTSDKKFVYNSMLRYFRENNVVQGEFFEQSTEFKSYQ